jgi:ferredoxin-NADP reductase
VSSTAVRTRLQITGLRVRGVNGAPDGRVSSYLHDHVEVGDVLEVSAPAGDFVLTPTDSPLLLASAGAGITTVLPIVEHIAPTQPQRKVIVAHADNRAQDHALRETVLHLGREIDDFTSYTWYETSTRATPAPVKASSTCPTSHFRMTSRSSRAVRCRSSGLSGRRCSIEECRRRESAMRSSDPTYGRLKPHPIQ